ncbi:hypothetical protein [Ancylobacter terrae]|uniref:hypothetical protein n=1 Tax=Ancylobacter sp. sgz301288 TaxID=3342077 RepID=UPI00385E4EEC
MKSSPLPKAAASAPAAKATLTPRIRAFLPGPARLPVPSRAGDAPQVFRSFGRTLEKLERAATTRRPRGEGEGT